jgi:hypothetical protein
MQHVCCVLRGHWPVVTIASCQDRLDLLTLARIARWNWWIPALWKTNAAIGSKPAWVDIFNVPLSPMCIPALGYLCAQETALWKSGACHVGCKASWLILERSTPHQSDTGRQTWPKPRCQCTVPRFNQSTAQFFPTLPPEVKHQAQRYETELTTL